MDPAQLERLNPHQIREIHLRAGSPEDDKPARITTEQVLRVQQIVSSTLSDGVFNREQLAAVETFLTAVVIESSGLRQHSALDVDQAWVALDRLPLTEFRADDATLGR